MRTRWLGWVFVAGSGLAFAQQVQNTAITRPTVQAAGGINGAGAGAEQPGGISYVTRRRSTAGNINVVNGFFAAGGVPVVATAGPAGVGTLTQADPNTVASTAPRNARESRVATLDPQVVATLRRLAASGNKDAQRVLAGAGLTPR